MRAFLSERGYRVAGVTLSFDDDAQADPFYFGDVKAPLAGDPVGLPSYAGEPQAR